MSLKCLNPLYIKQVPFNHIEFDMQDMRWIYADTEKGLRDELITIQLEIIMMKKEGIEDKEHESAFKDKLIQELNMIKSEIKDIRKGMEMRVNETPSSPRETRNEGNITDPKSTEIQIKHTFNGT